MARAVILFVLAATAASGRADGPEVRTFEGHGGTVRPALAPNGKTLATASDDQTIKLWDVATGKEMRSLPGHGSGVWRAVFSPDGEVLAAVADKRVFVWNPATGEKLRQFDAHAGTIRAIAFSPDGKTLATGGRDEVVRLWDAATGEKQREVPIERRGKLWEGIWSIAFSPNGKLLAVGSGNGVGKDGHLRVIDAADGTIRQTFAAPNEEQVWAVAFSPVGRYLASGTITGGRVTIRASDTWKVVREWVAGGSLRALAYSPDGKVVATAIDRDVVLWEADTGKRMRVLSGHTNWIMQIAFAPDGKLLVSGGSDRTARLWRLD